MKIRGADGRFQAPGARTRAALPDPFTGLTDVWASLADSQETASQQPADDDHAALAAQLLRATSDAALPPSLRIEAAQAHALLALVDRLDQLHARQGPERG